MEYADTSFIVSLFTLDKNHAAAAAHMANKTVKPDIPLTPFGIFELQNTLRRVLSPADSAKVINSVRGDTAFERVPLESYRWLQKADELSRAHVWTNKTKALDVLHVAAAILRGRSVFLTFDLQQRRFARVCGLVAPNL